MTLFFVIVVIAILGYFVVNIYRHDNTAFYKLTGYSYFDLWTNKKVRTAHNLVNVMDDAKGSHKMLVNLQVPVNNEMHMIDSVLIHESGIYVINVKEKTGWINGREQDIQWTELLHKNQSRVFENPIHETKRLSYAVQDQLPEMNDSMFHSVVLFTNDCSFQQVEIHSEDADVIKASEMKQWVHSLKGNHLSETEIQSIYAALEGMMNVKGTTLTVNNPVTSTN
ncbi:5,10-methylenetetrahydrofolate reductase [Lysinibacillus sp. 2017]|uniref:nuclease-related domain-containing protein n=1 Tax=unclassified Lysinibacillus TaxID=2636778 RepID=UPI000D528BF0|nr:MULTISPECIES: nuclease-related domain-containing protein [unclassified Lysinibacillus]AWE08984.1 5,10-methylenetetrahydrofolate reductase [Lysinibacillus sp. 2017]TGN35508.1 NERD domain-containing protein [Lysinibacillus sp. S2017]